MVHDRWIYKANDSLDKAASRILRVVTGMKELYTEQLRSSSEADRNPGEMTVAYRIMR